MSDEITPPAFESYPCPLGDVIEHQGNSYIIRTPSGAIIGVPANGVPSPEAVAYDLANPPAVIPPVPASVGPAQLRIALRRLHPEITAGAVYALIGTLPTEEAQDDARDLWDYATVIQRAHPVLTGLASAFSLSPDQVDDVFRLAATL